MKGYIKIFELFLGYLELLAAARADLISVRLEEKE